MELHGSSDAHLFSTGRLVATPGVLEITKKNGQDIDSLLMRHLSGDWGDMHDEDKEANDASLSGEIKQRVMSSYDLPDGNKVWIITEWDRSVTTLLLPSEY